MEGLRLHHIHHAFGTQCVLEDISLHVAPNKIACLLGPSGCGKTTLLRIIAGLEKPSRGQIAIGERMVTDMAGGVFLPPERRRVGMMFQDGALFPHLCVHDNVRFGLNGHRAQGEKWIEQASARLGMENYMSSYPHQLSGGQSQRVSLLRALAASPKVLLLDEPFSGLDAHNRILMREETIDFLKESPVAIVVVTHDPEEAMFMADTIFVLNEKGRIIQSGSPSETWLGPVNRFVTELFGPVNCLSGIVKGQIVATQAGRFSAARLKDGTKVDVLIRPDGITIQDAEDEEGLCGDILSARLLGRISHLRIQIKDAVLNARLSGVILPKEGTRVRVLIEKCSVFVFPHEDKETLARHAQAFGLKEAF